MAEVVGVFLISPAKSSSLPSELIHVVQHHEMLGAVSFYFAHFSCVYKVGFKERI